VLISFQSKVSLEFNSFLSSFRSNILDGSIIDVFFRNNEFFPSVRQRQFTEIDFLSYVGGTLGVIAFLCLESFKLFPILGLFAGFSFLTILEVIVYFFVRSPLSNTRSSTKVEPLQVQTNPPTNKDKITKAVLKPVNFFYSYMEQSSIHGLSHATMKHLHGIEKVFWMIAFLVSMVLCGLLLRNLHHKYKTSPIAVSFDGDLQSVKNVSASGDTEQ
jgi:hypothetical protein